MFGMRLYELTDRPLRPFLAAQAQRSPIVRGYEAFVATAAIAGQDPVETTRLLATEIERARRFGFTTEELDAAKRDVLNRYTEAAAERETSDSSSLADELGRHYFTDQPVPGIPVGVRAREGDRAVSYARGGERSRRHGAVGSGGASPSSWSAAPAALGATEPALREAVTEVLKADITPYRGVKMQTQLLEQNPAAGKLVSETNDAALGTTSLAYANGVRGVSGRSPRPTRVMRSCCQRAATAADILDRRARPPERRAPGADGRSHGLRVAQPDGAAAVPEHQAWPMLASSFTPYTNRLDALLTCDDIATMLQLVYLKLTAPRLDAPRFEASRTAISRATLPACGTAR